MKKKISIIIAILAIILTACSGSDSAENPLKVGVTSGPHEQVTREVKEIAKDQGLEIDIIVFNEYVQPNIQLHEEQIDVNIFQHQPYLDSFNGDRNYNLVGVANTINFPMGIYSNKINDLSKLQDGDKVGIPNDATNLARSLILLQSAGIITLDDSVGIHATVGDIIDNPKNLRFVELDAPVILRTLPDLAIAAINTNFIIEAGMNPVNDSIYLEPKDAPWVNVIATRPELQDDPRVLQLVEIYHSDEIRQFIEKEFNGAIIPGF